MILVPSVICLIVVSLLLTLRSNRIMITVEYLIYMSLDILLANEITLIKAKVLLYLVVIIWDIVRLIHQKFPK